MSQSSWIGQTIKGRYKIEAFVGQGGMSAVYKAADPNLKRVVAIKMIHPHLSDNAEFVRRFEEEAATVAQFRHPNIVQVFDSDNEGGTYYMVLEFIPGESLQDRLKRLNAKNRAMPVEEAVELVAQVADAAQYAHDRGMIHRDIKPANIMLDVHGKAILMDFGLSRMVGGHSHTATGAVLGTAKYMSPEQIIGERVDERTDIYSLGVTLFEALSGHPPYEADSAMTLIMMHVNDPIPDIRELRPDLPEALAAVVEKAMQKKRELRFQSMGQMAAALRAAAGGQIAPAQPAQPGTEPAMPDLSAAQGGARLQPAAPAGGTPLEPRGAGLQPAAPAGGTQPAPRGVELQPAAPASGAPQGAARGGTDQRAPEPAAGAGSPGRAGFEARSTAGSGSPPQPIQGQPMPAQQPAGKRKGFGLGMLAGIGLALLALAVLVVIGAVLLLRDLVGGTALTTAIPTYSMAIEMPAPTRTTAPPLATRTTAPPLATRTTAPPLVAPTSAYAATPTVPPGIPYVRINNITVSSGRYVVEYETFLYTEQLPGVHVHFFFDTVKPEQAGVPGSGPWILYGGPRPFTKYGVSDRPSGANQMCALVANANHSVQPNSGNCFKLP